MSISLRRLNSTAIRTCLKCLFLALPFLLLAGAFEQAQAAGITLAQHIGKDAGTTTTSTLAFTSPNTAGNFIAVAIRGGLSSSQVFTVTDSNGNTYKQAAQIGYAGSAVTTAIYYGENIKGGANTVTVSMTVSGPLRFDILEYSGVATSGSLDATAVNTATNSTPTSGNLTTTVSGDLLLAAIGTTNAATFTAGAGFTIRDFVPAEPSTKHISEDQIQSAAGLVSAGASLAASDSWGAVLAAFKPAGGVAGVPATIVASAGTPQSAAVNTTFGTQLQATVKDSFNNPVSGATVTFTAPNSGASATFAGGVTIATTNSSGVATAAAFTANAVAGAYNVTASVSGVSTPANFSLTNLAGPAASIAATAGTPQSTAINTVFSAQLQVTVTDSQNNPVSGVTVTFTAPTNGASGTFTGGVSSTTTTTNAQGIATAPVFTANSTVGGPYTVTASASGVSSSANFSLTNLSNAVNIALVQHTSIDAGSVTTASLAFASGNIAGNWIAVCIRGGSSSAQVFTVSDSNKNTYQKAGQIGFTGSAVTLAIYFAENIKGGVNTVTVSDTVAGPFRFEILEYSGVATSGSMDVAAAVATGTSSAPNSGNLTTIASGDLLLASVASTNSGMFTAGTGFTIRDFVPAEPGTKLISEDQIQAAPGTASASVSLAASDNWGAILSAFKPASGGGGGPAPNVSGLNPTSGPAGTSVTISGSNFGSSQGNSTVTFNGTQATPTSWSATRIVAPVPSGASTGNVVVTVGGVASNGMTFTVSSPSISSLSLSQGPVGAAITITGTNFGATQGTSTVTFNGTQATASSWSSSSINVAVPSGATSGNVVVTVGALASNGVSFTVTPPPSITSISPTFGPIGGIMTITGNNFGPTVGTISSFVQFNGTQSRSSNWSNTSITVPVPQGATTGNVVVFVGGVASNGVLFTVTPPPSITTINPTTGPVGTSVTVSGSGFGSTQSTSTLTFNGTAATPTSWSDTSIVTPVPTGATPGNIVVSVASVPSNGVNFTVTSSSGNIVLVQHKSLDAGTVTSASLAFNSNTTAGNWIAVVVRAGSSSSQAFTVSDSSGNTFRQGLQFGLSQTALTFAIYYAESIKGGADTITVSDTVAGPFRISILEYSGVAPNNSLDATPITAQGNSASPNTGSLTTSASGDLLLSVIVTTNATAFTAGTGYTIEEAVPASPNTKLIAMDQLQRSSGTVSAGASITAADNWGAGLMAVRSASGAGLPVIVTVSPSTASVPTGYGTQAFTATLQNDFQGLGVSWSLSGTGCSGVVCGTLSNATTTSVTYSAPANVPSPASVTLKATSIADSTRSGTAAITVTQGTLNVGVSPKRASVTMSASQTIQFTATVTNDPQNLGVTWQVDGNNGGNPTTGTVSITGLYTPGTAPGVHNITATSVADASVSASATVAVTDLAGVYTHHNDNARTGQNLQEYALTAANVNSTTFGKLFSCPVDGFLFAAPLYVSHLTIGGQTRNVLFVATSHDSVYAFDADSSSCVQLWTVSFLSTGVTTVPTADVNDSSKDMFPEIGITSTPVIDPSTNTIYVEAKTKDTVSSGCSSSTPCYFHHLHAMDVMTGAEKLGGPVLISSANFNSKIHHQRPALLLNNGTLYIGFGSHADANLYQGWLMAYNAATLNQLFVIPLTNAAGNRGGVWTGGAGPAVDSSGNIYVTTGNGSFDANGGGHNYGDSVVKLNPTGTILDYFTPFNQSTFASNDIDLGSAGVVILPDSVGSSAHPHLALVTGKVAILYLLDQNNLGKFNSSSNTDIQEVIPVPPPNTTQLDGGNFGSVAYWNGNIYSAGVNYPLSQFSISNGAMSTTQVARSSNNFPLRGAIPVVSASAATNGIVWILDLTAWPSNGPAILDAYDATDVGTLLYSSPASGAGAAAPAVKFTIPVVANGKVYVGGQNMFTVFGLQPN
ncbi:MAG TPA: IPT/TIG domain-containing protein [Candidatus Bathyarchaeia archaeon]|nr:IPT/TIG domain-containing protein [Candidatus Bathyarchaeia archaeon]